MTVLASIALMASLAGFLPSDEAPLPDYPALPAFASQAQDFVAPGWVVASKAEGDLDGDGRADLVLALWTAAAAKTEGYEAMRSLPPYRLVIAFARPGGGYRLVTDNRTLLDPPDFSMQGEDHLGAGSLTIDRGSLVVYRELIRGHYRYRFRWSDGAMRLIGYDNIGVAGGCITNTSINYLTRRATIETSLISEDRGKVVTRAVKRRPLLPLGQIDPDFFADGMGIIGKWPDCPRKE